MSNKVLDVVEFLKEKEELVFMKKYISENKAYIAIMMASGTQEDKARIKKFEEYLPPNFLKNPPKNVSVHKKTISVIATALEKGTPASYKNMKQILDGLSDWSFLEDCNHKVERLGKNSLLHHLMNIPYVCCEDIGDDKHISTETYKDMEKIRRDIIQTALDKKLNFSLPGEYGVTPVDFMFMSGYLDILTHFPQLKDQIDLQKTLPFEAIEHQFDASNFNNPGKENTSKNTMPLQNFFCHPELFWFDNDVVKEHATFKIDITKNAAKVIAEFSDKIDFNLLFSAYSDKKLNINKKSAFMDTLINAGLFYNHPQELVKYLNFTPKTIPNWFHLPTTTLMKLPREVVKQVKFDKTMFSSKKHKDFIELLQLQKTSSPKNKTKKPKIL